MRFCLDTNVVSELRKVNSGKTSSEFKSWTETLNLADTYISVITLLELEQGVLLIERRDTDQGKLLRQWLDQQVLATFKDRILPIDHKVALRCASLHVPDPKPERDALIAATALEHGLIVVTRNTIDFQDTGVDLADPWRKSNSVQQK